MKAKEIMTKNVFSVDENTTVKEAAGIMARNDIGAIVVNTRSQTFGIWLGIFTQGDLLNRVVAEGRDIENTRLKDVMTDEIKCVQADDDVEDILSIMYEEKVHYLPVIDGRDLVGIISMTDLFRVTFRGAEAYQEEII